MPSPRIASECPSGRSGRLEPLVRRCRIEVHADQMSCVLDSVRLEPLAHGIDEASEMVLAILRPRARLRMKLH